MDVIRSQNTLGEGVRWQPREGRLYWVDIELGRVHSIAPPGREIRTVPVGSAVGCLGFRSGGGLILATRQGFALLDPGESAVRSFGSVEPAGPGSRFNDGAVDRAGRFWAGTMTESGFTNSLYRLSPDGSISPMLSGLGICNGIGWSPDNSTLYFTDSARGIIFAFDFDLASGEIDRPRPVVAAQPGEGTPDGLAVDSEGCLWSAHWDGWAVRRFDPRGSLVSIHPVPVQRPTSCAFGGPDLDVLYVTSARVGLSPAELAVQRQAGDLFILDPGVRGLPEPFFPA